MGQLGRVEKRSSNSNSERTDASEEEKYVGIGALKHLICIQNGLDGPQPNENWIRLEAWTVCFSYPISAVHV